MILTEDEAKTKWCPERRSARLVEDNSANSDYPRAAASTNDGATCIGSRCMLWKWITPPNRDKDAAKRRGTCGLGSLERDAHG